METRTTTSFNSCSDDDTVLRFKKVSVDAISPLRSSRYAAGFDLYSVESKRIRPQSHAIVDTGIAIQLLPGTYGRIAPRSGLAARHSIDVGAGVLDRDFTGSVLVVLFNHHPEQPFQVNVGDRVAQLIVEKICTPKLVEVEELEATERGVGSFGSTGKN